MTDPGRPPANQHRDESDDDDPNPSDESSDVAGELARVKQELARANEELSRAREGLDAFVRSASHDLKAPLRHIFGFCGFVREGAADRLTEEEMTDLQRVMDAASHLSKLLESLSRFAKLGVTSLRQESFHLREVVDMVLAQMSPEEAAHVRCEQLAEVHADRALLTVVMQNLIENALKYVDEKPPVVTINSESTTQGLLVRVADNGIGVERQNLTRIFEAGVRGVSDAEFAGTGFGLATCARIINAHQGRIWVEANPPRGSIFQFVLPHHDRS